MKLEDKIDKIHEDLIEFRVEIVERITKLETKSAIWGSLAGLVISSVVSLLFKAWP